MKKRAIALLAAAHLFDDVNQGVIPALIPFFISERGFTIAAAAGLVFASNVSSSILQPLFGALADRKSTPWLVPAGLFLAGAGVAAAGLAPGYFLVLACAGVTGIGVAAFHPEAARQVYYQSGAKRATAMSFFATGGNLGFAIGPAIATPIGIALGLRGMALMVIPAFAMALVLVRTGALRHGVANRPRGEGTPAPSDRWGAFAKLSGPVICRAVVFYALNTFIPLYWIREFSASKAAGGAALTLMLSSGVAGTLAGGWLADRFGRRIVVLASMLLLFPLLLAFLAARSPAVALALMVPIGLFLYSPFSVMTVLAQEYLPGRVGTASGLTIGLAVTLGGLAAPVLGRIADLRGVRAAVTSVAFVPLLGAAFALTLPREGRDPAAGLPAD